MKTVVVWGNMSADRTADQYPTENVCDECFKTESAKEESKIVQEVDKYDPAYGDECFFCGKAADDE